MARCSDIDFLKNPVLLRQRFVAFRVFRGHQKIGSGYIHVAGG
jgi:hypothetical protein